VLADGVVYVGGDEGVWAFTAQTGIERWHFSITNGEASALLLANGAIHTLGLDGVFYSITIRDGSLHWKIPYRGGVIHGALVATGGTFDIALAAADGRLYLDADEGAASAGIQAWLMAYDLRTGRSLWGNGLTNGFQGLSAGGGSVYVKVDQTMTAFAGTNGSKRWAAAIADVNASSLGNGVLYVGSISGSLYALQTGNGSITWQTPLGQVSVYSMFLG
jgi:outer membrane protein assembly factor BamB